MMVGCLEKERKDYKKPGGTWVRKPCSLSLVLSYALLSLVLLNQSTDPEARAFYQWFQSEIPVNT
jgi:hypothetical protein